MRPIKQYWGWRACAKGVVWVKVLNSEAAGHSAGAGGREACSWEIQGENILCKL